MKKNNENKKAILWKSVISDNKLLNHMPICEKNTQNCHDYSLRSKEVLKIWSRLKVNSFAYMLGFRI
jgi:hypothetical protein